MSLARLGLISHHSRPEDQRHWDLGDRASYEDEDSVFVFLKPELRHTNVIIGDNVNDL